MDKDIIYGFIIGVTFVILMGIFMYNIISNSIP